MRAIKVEDDGDGAAGARRRPRSHASPNSAPSRGSITAICGATRNASSAARSPRRKNGVIDCVEGASVQLVKDGDSVAVTTTDNYGDFKFDRLDENSGRYSGADLLKRPRQDRGGHARGQRQSRRDQDLTDAYRHDRRSYPAPCARSSSCCAVSPAHVTARAQQYPDRPVHILVGFAAGSGPDVLARTVAAELGAELGQSFVVENHPGANGTIATQAVAHATPDGYTLLFTSDSIAATPFVYKSLPYDVFRDLAPIGTVGILDGLLMLVNPSSPAHNVNEFIAYAKTHRVLYGSPGIGNGLHLAAAMFSKVTGLTMEHVPLQRRVGSGCGIAGQQYRRHVRDAAVGHRPDQGWQVAGVGVQRTASVPGIAGRSAAEGLRSRFSAGESLGNFLRAGQHPDRDHRQAQRHDPRRARAHPPSPRWCRNGVTSPTTDRRRRRRSSSAGRSRRPARRSKQRASNPTERSTASLRRRAVGRQDLTGKIKRAGNQDARRRMKVELAGQQRSHFRRRRAPAPECQCCRRCRRARPPVSPCPDGSAPR